MNLEEYHGLLNKMNDASRRFVEKEGLLNPSNSLSFYKAREHRYEISEEQQEKYMNMMVPFYQLVEMIEMEEIDYQILEQKKLSVMFPKDGISDSKLLGQISVEQQKIKQKLEIALSRFEQISKYKFDGLEIPKHIAQYRGLLNANQIVCSMTNKSYSPIPSDLRSSMSHMYYIYKLYQEKMDKMNQGYYRGTRNILDMISYLRIPDKPSGLSYGRLIKRFEKQHKNNKLLVNPNYRRHETTKLDVSRYKAFDEATSDLPVKEKEILALKDAIINRHQEHSGFDI